MIDSESTQLVNLRELSRRLRRYGITQAWLRGEAETGRIPSLRAGRRRLYSLDAVKAVLIQRAAEGEVNVD